MLQLKTLGGLSIQTADGGSPTGAATQRRRLSVLAVLAASGDTGVSREKLIAMFWPDAGEERARAALAQALYALRRDVGAQDLVLGTTSLRLNEVELASDIQTFRRAIAERRWAAAAECYAGPFLDGIQLPDAPEFERWTEVERGGLGREAVEVFERLAGEATTSGDHQAAVKWWQRRVMIDPLATSGALGLMESLAAAGDRATALQHARIYEAMIVDQLELPPDPSVTALASRLRSTVPAPERTEPGPAESGTRPEPEEPDRASGIPIAGGTRIAAPLTRWMAGTVLVVVVAAAFAFGRSRRAPADAPAATTTVIAVAAFTAYGPDLTAAARSLTDMLATNLAQVDGINVLSTARMYELAAEIPGEAARALHAAARRGGATDVIDGAVYAVAGGVRLDLRRTAVGTGAVIQAVSVTAPDLFTAVDSGTAKLLSLLGGGAAVRPVADVTTGSLIAYQLYLEGLRTYFEGHRAAAFRLFDRALSEDSTFAMAAYYATLSGEGSRVQNLERLDRAVRLARNAGDRERLLIQWKWADVQDDPSRSALSDTLVARFASEPFAHFHRGLALAAEGRFAEAVREYRMAITLDRGSEPPLTPGRCVACEARGEIVAVLRDLDSLDAAERGARAAIAIEGSAGAWLSLRTVLAAQGRADLANDAAEHEAAVNPGLDLAWERAIVAIHTENYGEANTELVRRLGRNQFSVRSHAAFWLVVSYRAQGRLEDALEPAHTVRAADSTWGQRDAAPYLATTTAAIRYEQGRFRAAAALWDSIARLRTPRDSPSRGARNRAWFLTLASTALAAEGDTAGLGARADTVEMLGRQSAFARDHRLHHHIRGLLYAARGRHEEAVESFRRAILTPRVTYSRSVHAMAKSLLALGRPREGIAVLRPLTHGPGDGSNMYLPRTEIHEQLAELFLAGGQPDSAAAHAARVVEAWAQADPSFAARRRRMEDIAARR